MRFCMSGWLSKFFNLAIAPTIDAALGQEEFGLGQGAGKGEGRFGGRFYS